MNARAAAALGLAVALGVAACGGGGGKKATTTSSPSTSVDTAGVGETTTTTGSVDPALQALLLVAADLPSYKEPANPAPAGHRSTSCDPTTAPAIKAMLDAPSVEGSTFEKGTDGALKVSSSVIGATPEVATAGLTQLIDPKVLSCLEADVKAAAEKDLPSGSTLTLKLTAAKSTVAGVEQTVLLSGTGTVKSESTDSSSSTTTKSSSTTSKAGKTTRYDLVFLRQAGTVLVVTFGGPTDVATVVERQRIVAIAAKKLAGTGGGSATTTVATGAGGSTSSTSKTSTTRKTSTTVHSTTTKAGNTTIKP